MTGMNIYVLLIPADWVKSILQLSTGEKELPFHWRGIICAVAAVNLSVVWFFERIIVIYIIGKLYKK
jgi:hypothetical protein